MSCCNLFDLFFIDSFSLAPLKSLTKLTTSKPKDAIDKSPATGNPIPVAADAAASASKDADVPAIDAPVISPSCALIVASIAPSAAPATGTIDFPNLPNAFPTLEESPYFASASGPPRVKAPVGEMYPLRINLALSPIFDCPDINLEYD